MTHLFDEPFDVKVEVVKVEDIEFPEGTEINPAIEKPGVLQSVLLRRTNKPLPHKPYAVVDGKRRVRSAVAYGHPTVPAVITDGSRGQIAAASAMLNAARNDNPVDEARNWKIALEEGKYLTVADLAKDMRVSAATIKKRLRLLELPEDLLVHVGTMISEGVAEKMANLAPEYRAEAINAAERQLDQGKKFTAQDFKNAQVKRREDQLDSLDTLFESASASGFGELFTTVSPLEQVISEVRRLAAMHGVELQDVVDGLMLSTNERETAPALIDSATERPPVNTPLDFDWLTSDEQDPGVQASAPAPTEADDDLDWLSEAPEPAPHAPVTARIQLGVRSAS